MNLPLKRLATGVLASLILATPKLSAKDYETHLLAKMIYGEARECTDIEKIAIGYTAINRIDDGKRWTGSRLSEVILKPNQYQGFNIKMKITEKNSYEKCLEIAEGIITKKYLDPTNGATHFHKAFQKKYPFWARSLTKIGRIDTKEGFSVHTFYRH